MEGWRSSLVDPFSFLQTYACVDWRILWRVQDVSEFSNPKILCENTFTLLSYKRDDNEIDFECDESFLEWVSLPCQSYWKSWKDERKFETPFSQFCSIALSRKSLPTESSNLSTCSFFCATIFLTEHFTRENVQSNATNWRGLPTQKLEVPVKLSIDTHTRLFYP